LSFAFDGCFSLLLVVAMVVLVVTGCFILVPRALLTRGATRAARKKGSGYENVVAFGGPLVVNGCRLADGSRWLSTFVPCCFQHHDCDLYSL
jgi:hypothetical protein